MISPINRISSMLPTRNEMNSDSSDVDINSLHVGISNSVEELAMSRTLFQKKEKKALSEDLGRLIDSTKEFSEFITELKEIRSLTKDKLFTILAKLKDDVAKYQLLRYLLANGNIDFELLKIINKELDEIKKKRKKISSLDLISSETVDFQKKESVDPLMFQRLYLNFLEFDGQMCSYFENLYKTSKKHKKIVRFISKMMNYEIFAITPSDDIELFSFMNEKRRLLNIMSSIYANFDKDKDKDKDKDREKSEEDDLSFINAILLNLDIDKLCSKMSSEKVSMLISYFNKIPFELFYSIEEKDDALSTMRNNVSYRFINNGLR